MEKTEIKKRIEKLLGTPAPEDWETNPDYKLSIVDIIAMFGDQSEPQATPKIAEVKTKIEGIIADYCDGTFGGLNNDKSLLENAHFIEWFGKEKTNKAPQECANRIMEVVYSNFSE